MPKAPDGHLSASIPRQNRKRIEPPKIRRPVIGLEAEFTLYVQEKRRFPEHVFRSPQRIIRETMIPRTGRSFHLPSGGAIYFDTGVIEVATPIIELEPGCCVRAVRSLWEQIRYVRTELDEWEKKNGAAVRLEGFSTHYNVSVPDREDLDPAGWQQAALLLTYLMHPPVMLLAANKLSTGVGIRPRPRRLEVTVDFTPDPELMVATSALVAGSIPSILEWPSFDLSELQKRAIPVIHGFRPRKHTSRKGFLARYDCFPQNPFAADPNAPQWQVNGRQSLSLRQIAREIAAPFRKSIRAVADASTVKHLFAVLDGRARSLLDFESRPGRYEDVGRLIDWNRRELDHLPRSKYEKVIRRIITHKPIRVGANAYKPERMQGWYEVVFRNTSSGRRRVFNLDELVRHCAV